MAASSIDDSVARVLDSRRPARPGDNTGDDDLDEDALIAELEEEADSGALATLREQRLEQLHAELSRAKAMRETSHGTFAEIKDEKQLMDITTSTKLCVVHFMKPDFNRCRIMDDKLRVLSDKHFDTRFVSINVENAPFLVVKLAVQVLPCVISFIDGVTVDRIIGFEGVGLKPDSITASELEARLLACRVLVRAKMTKDDDRRRVQQQKDDSEEEFDSDWD